MKKTALLTLTLALLLIAPAAYAASDFDGPPYARILTITQDYNLPTIRSKISTDVISGTASSAFPARPTTHFEELVLEEMSSSPLRMTKFATLALFEVFADITSDNTSLTTTLQALSNLTLSDDTRLELPAVSASAQHSGFVFKWGDNNNPVNPTVPSKYFLIDKINVGEGCTLDISWCYDSEIRELLKEGRVSFENNTTLVVPHRSNMGDDYRRMTDTDYAKDTMDFLKEWCHGASNIPRTLNVLEVGSNVDIVAAANTPDTPGTGGGGTDSTDSTIYVDRTLTANGECSTGASFIFMLPVLAACAFWKKKKP